MPRLTLMPLLLAAAFSCAACTGSDSDGIADRLGPGKPLLNTAPPSPGDGRDVEVSVQDDGVLDILTWGSGSCPFVPVEVERLTRTRVRVAMEARSRRDGDVCTTDLVPTVASMRLPDDVDYRSTFRIDLEGVGPVRSLGARAGFTNAGAGGDIAHDGQQ